jgi:hypothetical protein
LIQLARKEEEEQHTKQRQKGGPPAKLDPELVQYVADRLRKLKPSKKKALSNSIASMFQFQGGISDDDKERMFSALQKRDTSSLRRTVAFSIHVLERMIGTSGIMPRSGLVSSRPLFAH